MDICSYLNSPDVAEHCRRTGHRFNALEAAFIVNDCRRISIEEKHRLYHEIMDTMPDMEIPNPRAFREKSPDLSLFHQLEKLIEQEDRILRSVQEGRKGWFYSYHIADGRSGYVSDCQGFYSAYEKLLDAVRMRLGDEANGIPVVSAEMRTLDSDRMIRVYLNAQCEISFILPDSVDDRGEDFDSFLYQLWVYIPTPFKMGDLVCGVNGTFIYPTCYSAKPMVLRETCCREQGANKIEQKQKTCDSSDMTAYGWWLGDDGYVFDECIHAYHNLTYYTGETEPVIRDGTQGKDYRLLKAISQFLKGEIDITMLLIINNALRAERSWNDSFPVWDYVDAEYDRAGLTKIREKRDLLREYEKKRAAERRKP